eukprot:4899786-Prymnesium_polylepis.1
MPLPVHTNSRPPRADGHHGGSLQRHAHERSSSKVKDSPIACIRAASAAIWLCCCTIALPCRIPFASAPADGTSESAF